MKHLTNLIRNLCSQPLIFPLFIFICTTIDEVLLHFLHFRLLHPHLPNPNYWLQYSAPVDPPRWPHICHPSSIWKTKMVASLVMMHSPLDQVLLWYLLELYPWSNRESYWIGGTGWLPVSYCIHWMGSCWIWTRVSSFVFALVEHGVIFHVVVKGWGAHCLDIHSRHFHWHRPSKQWLSNYFHAGIQIIIPNHQC